MWPWSHFQARRIGLVNELLLLFGYSPWSAAALFEGTLPLRYCAGRFATTRAAVEDGAKVEAAQGDHIPSCPNWPEPRPVLRTRS